jgi:hypothetical protein
MRSATLQKTAMEDSMAHARRTSVHDHSAEPRERRGEAPAKPASRPITITLPSGNETDVWREARRMRDEWRRNRYARIKSA